MEPGAVYIILGKAECAELRPSRTPRCLSGPPVAECAESCAQGGQSANPGGCATPARASRCARGGANSRAAVRRSAHQIRTQQATLDRASERTSVSAERLAEAVARTLQLATSLWDLYEQFDDTKRAELLRGVFNAIVLAHNGVVGVTLKSPLDALTAAGANQLKPTDAAQLAEHILKAA